VAGEAAIGVVARHRLPGADIAAARGAEIALAAGDDGRDQNVPSQPFPRTLTGCLDGAGDLVAKHQRQRRPSAHVAVVEAQVGMADAAACNPDDDLAGARFGHGIGGGLERAPRFDELPGPPIGHACLL